MSDKTVIRLEHEMCMRLAEHAAAYNLKPKHFFSQLMSFSGQTYSDYDIQAWRMFMLETEEPQSKPSEEGQFWLDGKTTERLMKAAVQHKLSIDDMAAVIVADAVDNIFGRQPAKPAEAKILPFRRKHPLK